MKVFIREYCRDVIIRINGIDGEEHTKDFFAKYLCGVNGVYETTDEERTEYSTEAEYTIEKGEYYDFFIQHIDNIQKGIDTVSEALKDTISQYIIDGRFYIV